MVKILEDEKVFIFSNFSGTNIYELSGGVKKSRFGRTCRASYVWNDEMYRFSIVDFYENPDDNCRVWLENEWEECFGGKYIGGPFIWPSDYFYSFGDKDEKSSLVLVYGEKQFEDLIPLKKLQKMQSLEKYIQQIFLTIGNLHKQGFGFNGIDMEQLWYRNGEVLIQIVHNLLKTSESEKRKYFLGEYTKGIYREELYSIPKASCWECLPVHIYARCNDVYSAATMLFEALIGRHPLNGRLCDDQEDDWGRMVIYSQFPCFIFDKKSSKNSIGQFPGEEECVKRWENLPEKLRDLFEELYEFPDFGMEEAEAAAVEKRCFQADIWARCLDKEIQAEGESGVRVSRGNRRSGHE